VGVAEENVRPPVAAMDNVARDIQSDGAGDARHAQENAARSPRKEKK